VQEKLRLGAFAITHSTNARLVEILGAGQMNPIAVEIERLIQEASA